MSDLDDAMAELWDQSFTTVLERVATIRAGVMSDATMGDRAAAKADAHRLAGSLGMFGRVKAGEVAQQIEAGLEASLSAARLQPMVDHLESLLSD